MDFSFTEEQIMLRDSVRRVLRESYDFETCRRVAATPNGHDPAAWAQFAELQWQAIPFNEDQGGLDCGPVELLLLMEELGRGLCAEPYLANVVLAGQLLARLGTAEQRSEHLPPLIQGERHLSLAWAELAGRYDPLHCATRAQAQGDGFVLNGAKSVVLNGPNAAAYIVLARSDGAVADTQGLSLFMLPADSPGIDRRDYPLLGGGVACELRLQDVRVPQGALLGAAGAASSTLVDVLDLATVASCAEAYGAMQALLEKTVEYLKTRKQFGVPLASLQVLQHRMVDMFIEVQQSQSMMLMAMLRIGSDDRYVRQRAASACKAYLHKAGKFVAQQAVQLHGGIGVTEELDIGHYFRRLTAFGSLFGDREYHLRRYAALAAARSDAGDGSLADAA